MKHSSRNYQQSISEKKDDFLSLREQLAYGGKEKWKKQHAKGKLTARERINLLVDEGSFVEIDAFVKHNCTKFDMDKNAPLGDGVITGYAKINNRNVYIYSQDFSVFGGSLGQAHASKITKIMDLAIKTGVPIIGLLDSGGARIQEGVDSLAGYGDIFYRNVQASGVIPQISVILGPCAGGAVYSPALTDFVIMNKTNAFMFVTGPSVVKAVTGEDVSFYDLGGSDVHQSISGICHLVGDSEIETLDYVKELLAYIPSNNLEDSPTSYAITEHMQEEIYSIIPDQSNDPYDMKEIMRIILDQASFFEIQGNWAKNIIIGFARLDGSTVGLIANQPLYLGGAIDIHAADKASRFIRFCDAFNIPIVTFVDVPGFMPGLKQEHEGIIRHGAKMLFAYSEATVPKISVIVRKAYGGAYIVMSSKHLGADINYAWPNAEIAVMGAEGACKILYRKKIKESENPDDLLEEFTNQYKKEFANPYQATEKGYVDKVILPEETRHELIRALDMLKQKRENIPKRKHGVFPV